MNDLNHLATLVIKIAAVAGGIILIFNLFYFIDKKLNEYLPKLPPFILYVLIVILAILWVLVKLIGFGFIKP